MTSLISVISTASNGFKNTATAQDVRTANNTKDLVVTIGGLKWMVTYVSGATYSSGQNDVDIMTENDILVTFWLANSRQLSGKYTYNSLGEKVAFGNNGYGYWQNWSDGGSARAPYPSNMYGTSFVRSVILNNGGDYAINKMGLTSFSKQPDSIFSLYTVQSGEQNLYNYIVKPSKLNWQLTENTKSAGLSIPFNLQNDGSSQTVYLNASTKDFDGSSLDYTEKDGYDAWIFDKIWLPSVTETGYNSTYNGLWELSNAQRSNNWRTWLRTAGYNSDNNHGSSADGMWLDYNGSSFGSRNDVNIKSVCIRPAFHFNLSTAAKTIGINILTTPTIGINILTTPAHGVVVDVLMPTVFTVLTGFVVVYYVINSKKTKKLNKIC